MANDKFYTVSKEYKGVKYTAQFNGIAAAVDAIDDCYIDGTNNISTGKLARYILEKVIVEPKNLTMDDFDNIKDFNEVVNWGRDVMQGLFQEKKDKDTAKAAGK